MWWLLLVANGGFVSSVYDEYCADFVSENPLARCTKCGAVVKDTDSVLDAIRIGGEALNKANRVQFSGM
jgi:hypothetical protein